MDLAYNKSVIMERKTPIKMWGTIYLKKIAGLEEFSLPQAFNLEGAYVKIGLNQEKPYKTRVWMI